MRMIHAFILAAAAPMLACSVGTKASDFRPAQSPRGVHASLSLKNPSVGVEGELLAVQDTALIVLWAEGSFPHPVCFVPLSRIKSSDFPQMHGGDYVSGGHFASPDAKEHLRLVSRFPQGISPALRDKLFATYHQTQFDLPGVK